MALHAAGTKPRLARLLGWLALALLALVAAQYLAGSLFLWSVRGNPRAATPLTIARYAYYYGQRSAVRERLVLCSGLAAGLVGLASVARWLPRRRSLHGDARFARPGEMAAAGLFSREGIIVGRLGRRYLMLAGQQGVALAAPPRA